MQNQSAFCLFVLWQKSSKSFLYLYFDAVIIEFSWFALLWLRIDAAVGVSMGAISCLGGKWIVWGKGLPRGTGGGRKLCMKIRVLRKNLTNNFDIAKENNSRPLRIHWRLSAILKAIKKVYEVIFFDSKKLYILKMYSIHYALR